jgi:hypothetical protein
MKIVMTFCLAVKTVSAQVIPDQYIVVLKDDAPAAKGREIAS